MSMEWTLCKGTGRARCRLCGEPIGKGQRCLKVTSFNNSGQVHVKCVVSPVERLILEVAKK